MKRGWFTTPDLLTVSRLIIAPVMLLLAWGGKRELFLVAFGLALLSDAVDGALARRLKLASTGGAQLDSWCDLAMYVSAGIGAWWCWPQILWKERLCVFFIVVCYAIPILFGFAKFRRLPSYHTWGAKISALVIGTSLFVMFIAEVTWPFRVATPVFVISSMEEIGITALLPAWRANVPSFWHALRVRKALEPAAGTGQPAGGQERSV